MSPRNAPDNTASIFKSCIMDAGYWLIETDEIDVLSAHPQLKAMARIVLDWLAKTVSADLDLKSCNVQIDVIDVFHHANPASYPGLGATCSQGEISNELADQILSAIRRRLSTTTLLDFVTSVGRDSARQSL